MEICSVYKDCEQEALRFKWIESEKAGRDLGRGRHLSLGPEPLVGLPEGPLARTPARQALLGGTRPRRLRSAPATLPGQGPSPRPHPRSSQSRPGKPRHHPLGAGLGHPDGARLRDPRSPRHQQPPTGTPLRRHYRSKQRSRTVSPRRQAASDAPACVALAALRLLYFSSTDQ